MRRFLIAKISIILLLMLDWAALDDITTGNEPDYFKEYAILFFSVAVFIFIFSKRGFLRE